MSVVLWGSMERRMRDIYGSVAEIASRPPTICGGSYGAARRVAAEGRVAWLLDVPPGRANSACSSLRSDRRGIHVYECQVMLPAYIPHQHRRYAVI